MNQIQANSRKSAEELAPKGALAAGTLIILAAFLPWVTLNSVFGSISKTGIEGDGVLTLVLGIVVAAFAGVHLLGMAPRKVAQWGVLIAGALAGLAGLVDLVDTYHRVAELNASSVAFGHVGIGLYLTYFAGSFAFLAGIFMRKLQEPTTVPTALYDDGAPATA